jgi:hypothetical protein
MNAEDPNKMNQNAVAYVVILGELSPKHNKELEQMFF